MGEIDHRRLGVDLSNATWELLDREDRTADADDAMVSRAHASFYHWGQVPGVARHACVAVTDAEDRAVVEADLATLPRRP